MTRVLVIAATDSSGGAGLTRDVRVLHDFGVDAPSVVTAVTAQSDARVLAIHHVPPDVIIRQIASQADRIDAIKIGMLGTRATVEAVAASLPAGVPVVVDPVLVSSSGGVLLDAGGREALLHELLPRATLVTPNVPELGALLDETPDESRLIQQGRRLLDTGAAAVLLKGGHRGGPDAVDVLMERHGAVQHLSARRVAASRRGTGCALASAIAAGLAHGKGLLASCQDAKRYVLEYLMSDKLAS